MPTPAENSKDLSSPEPVPDPGECGSGDAQIAGAGAADGVSSGKGDATPAVPVTAPIADAACKHSDFFFLSFQICLFFLFLLFSFGIATYAVNLIQTFFFLTSASFYSEGPSFSSWINYQKQNPNIEGAPWCRFLSQSAQVNSCSFE